MSQEYLKLAHDVIAAVKQQDAGRLVELTDPDSVPDPDALRDLILEHSGYAKQRVARSTRTFYAGN
jgi:hypothetical protein